MATDYDAPRKRGEGTPEGSPEELKSRRKDSGDVAIGRDEGGATDLFELPGADLSNEGLSARVILKRDGELVCSQCFMIHRASQLAYEGDGKPVCMECAGWGYTGKSKKRVRPSTGEEEA